jgi:hypothetical protein
MTDPDVFGFINLAARVRHIGEWRLCCLRALQALCQRNDCVSWWMKIIEQENNIGLMSVVGTDPIPTPPR